MSDSGEHPRRERRPRVSKEDASWTEGRSTERLDPADDEWKDYEPVNPDWRSSRSTRSGTRRATRAMSTSPQEVQIWLQQGGWRYIAAAAVLLILALILLLSVNRNARNDAPAIGETLGTAVPGSQSESGTILQQQSTTTAEPPTSAAPTAEAFVVVNTNGLGLFLRADHDSNSVVLETLPDGTRVEQIGEDFAGPNYVWRHVRAPSGQEGWVAVEWLEPAP